MSDFNEVAKAFVTFYYQTFDADRSNLASLYRDTSMLTFEGRPFQGTAAIVTQLKDLPFQKVAHRVSTMDAQPCAADGSILVIVSGQLLIDEEQNPQLFAQTFRLMPDGPSFYVYNDMFRLIYGA